MAQVTVNISMDAELKEQFDQLMEDLGLSMSSAITAFAKAAVNKGGFPFPLELPKFNEETKAAITETEHMLAHPDDTEYPAYESVDELFKAKGWE